MPRSSPRPGGAAIAVFLLTLLAIAGAFLAEQAVDPAVTPAAEPVAVAAPSAGAWYCPVTAEADETAILTVAAVGDEPATVAIDRHEDAGVRSGEPVAVEPGAPLELVLDDGEARWPSTVRWTDAPVVATWRVEGPDVAGAPCEAAPLPTTHITGFDTSAQSVSTLHLFNPFDADAVVRVTYGTSTGPVELVLTDNVLVEAGQGTTLTLNDFEPQQRDLAVSVEVLTGRVVSQGVVALAPTEDQPSPTGRAVLPGTGAPERSWAFAYARDNPTSSSWVSVFNPNERAAAVEVRVANPAEDSVALLGETSVPAGGVARVELDGAAESVEFGLVLESLNEETVVATRLTAVETGAGAEGVAASAGEQPARRWALVGGGAGDRQSRIALHNPGAETVTMTVDAGAGTPAQWRGITLAPNESTALELDDLSAGGGEREPVGVLVEADGPVTADLRVQRGGEEDGLRFWTVGGVPARVWEGAGVRPAVRRDPTLSTRPAVVEEPDEQR